MSLGYPGHAFRPPASFDYAANAEQAYDELRLAGKSHAEAMAGIGKPIDDVCEHDCTCIDCDPERAYDRLRDLRDDC